MAYQFPLNGGRINASIGGNSTSAGAGYQLVSTGTLHLMGGNNITLSQNANSITLSGAAIPSQTAYSFADGNGVSFGTNASTVTATVATDYAASNHSHGNPTLNLTNLSGTTASASNGLTLSLSAAAQSNQNISLYGLGNTTQNSSTVLNASNLSFNGLGGATVGFSNGSIQISGATGGAGGGVAMYDGANSITSGTARISAGGALTASVNGQTLSLNAPAQSQLSATGAVSISTNGSTISIGAPVQSNQTLGIYGVSNTTQSSSGTLDARSLSFQGAGGVSVGMTNGSVVISGATGGAGGGVALYDGANSISTGTARISAGGALTASVNGQTLSLNAPATSSISATGAVSIATNGSTISIGAPGAMSHWIHNSAAMYSTATSAMAITSASVVRMLIPENISFNQVEIPMSISGATSAAANTAAMALSAVAVIYSRSGVSLNPIVGQSSTTTYSYASNTGVYSSVTGPRLISFSLGASLTQGEYYLGLQLSSNTSSVGTATTNLGWTVAPVFGSTNTDAGWAYMSAATNASVNLYQPLQGVNSVSISNLTQTMQQSQITQTGTAGLRANLPVIFRNT